MRIEYFIYTIPEHKCSPWTSWKILYCQYPIGIIMGKCTWCFLLWLTRHDEVKWLLPGGIWFILPGIRWLWSWSLEPLHELSTFLYGWSHQALQSDPHFFWSWFWLPGNQNYLYKMQINGIKKQGWKVLLHSQAALLLFGDTNFQEARSMSNCSVVFTSRVFPTKSITSSCHLQRASQTLSYLRLHTVLCIYLDQLSEKTVYVSSILFLLALWLL